MNKYNPHIHHRRSIRLKGYDYSKAGLYFITICCQDRICRFGHIENGEMILNAYGKIAYDEWAKLPDRFPNCEMDVFQIMGKLWQRNYYEHIIRNEQSYHNISAYIINNPAKWKTDKFHPE